MISCVNGHAMESAGQRFCGKCGSPPLIEPEPNTSQAPRRVRRELNPRTLIVSALLVVALGLGAFFGVRALSESPETASTANLVGFVASSWKQDLYLLRRGEQPLPNTRLATDVRALPILPLEGPYIDGIEGPIPSGPTVVRLGDRTAVAWIRDEESSQVGTIGLVDSSNNVTRVLEESTQSSQAGPMSVWYSSKAGALLVEIYGEVMRCYRIDPDGTAKLLVRAGSCRFLRSGLIYAVNTNPANSYQDPSANTHEVLTVDLQGNEMSKTSIRGAAYLRSNETGERTLASSAGSPATFSVYETRTGGLLAEVSGSESAGAISTSRDSNAIAYSVDNGEEKLRMYVLRPDASTLDLGAVDRGAVVLSDDGTSALVATSGPLRPGVLSGERAEVEVKTLDIATGATQVVARGTDLRPSILGSGPDERVVVWSPVDATVWTGPIGGEIREFTLAASELRSVELMLGTNSLLLTTGPASSQSLEMLTADGVETVLTTQWDGIYPITASPDGRVIMATGTSDNRQTLLMWSDGQILEVDRAPFVRDVALTSFGVEYTVQTNSKESTSLEVRERSLDGKTPPVTVWSGAELHSSPTRSRPFESSGFMGSILRQPRIDEVANACKARGEPVLRPVSAAAGTIGSTKVCIIVPPTGLPVTLTVSSSTDTTMAVYNSSGTRVAYDDDSGTSRNPLLRSLLPAGTYVVEIKPYSARDGGTFLFSIS